MLKQITFRGFEWNQKTGWRAIFWVYGLPRPQDHHPDYVTPHWLKSVILRSELRSDQTIHEFLSEAVEEVKRTLQGEYPDFELEEFLYEMPS